MAAGAPLPNYPVSLSGRARLRTAVSASASAVIWRAFSSRAKLNDILFDAGEVGVIVAARMSTMVIAG